MTQPVSIRDRLDGIVESGRRRLGVQSPAVGDGDGHVGIVQGALRAFAEREYYDFLDALDAEVQWDAPAGNFPGRGGLLGRDGVREEFLGDVERTYSEFALHPESFLHAGDEVGVMVIGRFRGKGVQDEELDTRVVQVWEFSGKSAVRVCTITDTAAFPEVMTEARQRRLEIDAERKERESEE
jgi:ketosteroid isomerase-like protein